MPHPSPRLDPAQCRQARLARDARFDGRFFIGVRTTGIYCRPICPATLPQERNVCYFDTAIAAAGAGYRPCLRCRPDSAPGSFAWRGVETTLTRALRLIDEGALQGAGIGELCQRLGIGERYLRQLFQRRFGVSPKTYALYRQCLFAKQLLHQTSLPVARIAYASGFSSLRRFNDAFRRQMTLSPSDIRRTHAASDTVALTLKLAYRPPYDWTRLRHFHRLHVIDGLEWIDEQAYGRTFRLDDATGTFTAVHDAEHHCFAVTLTLSDLGKLDPVVQRIRRVLDLDADLAAIEDYLGARLPELELHSGLRIPGLWDLFEAGVRGILGQHVSIAAATRLIQRLVDELGEHDAENERDIGNERDAEHRRRFPTPAAVAGSDLAFLGMPESRRETLRRFASAYRDGELDDNPDTWTQLKGIGPWTAAVVRFRGLGDPDVWLAGDVGIKRALAKQDAPLDPQAASPWRSYLTLQLWNAVI